MEKGYYKDPKTGEIKPGSFEDAWSKFMTSKVYDADEMQLDDEDEIFISYDDDGAPLEEEIRKEFSLEETKAIAKEVSKGVAMALKAVGDEVTSMKAINIEPNSFEIYVEYKNGADDYFYFSIDEDDTLYLVDFTFDKELVDVGVKPSGEAVVNISVLASKLSNHWKSLPSTSEEIETDYMKYRKSFDDYLNEDMTDEELEEAQSHPVMVQQRIAHAKKAKQKERDKFAGSDPKSGSTIKGTGFDWKRENKEMMAKEKESKVNENEEDDPQEIQVGSYQTKYFDVCPGASSLYSNIEEKVEDLDMAERSAKLQDALFFIEKHILEDEETGDQEGYILTAENLADQIMAMAKMMGLEDEHSYIQGHVDTIKKALNK